MGWKMWHRHINNFMLVPFLKNFYNPKQNPIYSVWCVHCIEILKGLFWKLLVRLVKENFVKTKRSGGNKRICNDFTLSLKQWTLSMLCLFNPYELISKRKDWLKKKKSETLVDMITPTNDPGRGNEDLEPGHINQERMSRALSQHHCANSLGQHQWCHVSRASLILYL